MAKLFMVSVRDSAVDAFMRPFVVPARGAAVRSFRDEVKRGGDSEMSKHPSDYELYLIGEFDEQTGALVPVQHELLVRGKDCIEEAPDV